MRRPADHELAQRGDGALVVVRGRAHEDLGQRARQTGDRDGFLLPDDLRGAGAAGGAAARSQDEDHQGESIEDGAEGADHGVFQAARMQRARIRRASSQR